MNHGKQDNLLESFRKNSFVENSSQFKTLWRVSSILFPFFLLYLLPIYYLAVPVPYYEH